jgi:CHASE3 domain sensor protein
VVLALVLAAVFALLERNREHQAENQSWVSHTAQVLAELSSMEAALMESELAARGQLVSRDNGTTRSISKRRPRCTSSWTS